MQPDQIVEASLSYPNIDPIAFSLGPLAVHWYGIAYVAGILIGWLYARYLLKQTQLWRGATPPLTQNKLDDFITWSVLGIIIGGRLGYMLFYDLPQLTADPLLIFRIWDGGMSFHGGLLGMITVMILFSHRNRISTWSLFDLIATVTPVGLFFGRIANFINGELWGRVSDVPWAMVFPTGGPLPRHPSQLYEAGLEGLFSLLVLFMLVRFLGTLKKPGLTSSVFICLYALSRIFVEFFRQPDIQLGYLYGGWLTMGMILSLPMLAVGLWGVWFAINRARRYETGTPA
ncbi:prolipoprotein diacylglyceryl transferase [Martelella sp. HB161492]|uniref:prolipoprotein diacylglyceryl transferase n=1 Tax=Martelella sp. HB161492 TaxID=2720726 RepID=UPI00158FDD26|nr:prolipoprotein diacylglyceryl transferase [Martelella sp. HB161492]